MTDKNDKNMDESADIAHLEQLQSTFNAYREQILTGKSDIAPLFPPLKVEQLVSQFSRSDYSVRVVFDTQTYSVESISDNFEDVFGYTKDEFSRFNILLFFHALSWGHISFPWVATKWSWSIFRRLKAADRSMETKVCYCGLRVKRRDGSPLSLMVRFAPTEFTENHLFKKVVVTLDDISHLIKSDFWWGRIECGTGGQFKFHFVSTDKKGQNQDILSEREKDVLRLIALGKESKEIGETLFISTSTVEKHRRNMIARSGVRDTTALVQVAKMCGII